MHKQQQALKLTLLHCLLAAPDLLHAQPYSQFSCELRHLAHQPQFTMGDLTALHAQATRLILSLREGLERLEAAEV